MLKVTKVKLFKHGRLMKEIDNFIMKMTINFINEEAKLELLPFFERQSSMTSIIRSILDDVTEKLRAVKRSLNQGLPYEIKKTSVMWKNTMNLVDSLYARVKDISRSLFVQDGVPLDDPEFSATSMEAEIALMDVLEDEVPKILDNLGWEEFSPGERSLPVFAPIDVPGKGKVVLTPANQPTTKPGGLGG